MSRPDDAAMRGPAWVEVARFDDLVPGQGLEVVVPGGRILALFRLGGDRVVAVGGMCPHQRAHLAAGMVDLARETVTCSRLGCLRWRFDLHTGAHAAGLPVACPTYPVSVVAGAVLVALPA